MITGVANSKVLALYDDLIYLEVRTKLTDKVQLLATVLCAFPLETRLSLDQTTGRLCIWHVNPVTVADI